jgi:predicted amidohydrolase YtcJ
VRDVHCRNGAVLKDVAGILAPGMLADVAVLTQDLYTIPGTAIGDTSVAMTIAGGQVVHGDE